MRGAVEFVPVDRRASVKAYLSGQQQSPKNAAEEEAEYEDGGDEEDEEEEEAMKYPMMMSLSLHTEGSEFEWFPLRRYRHILPTFKWVSTRDWTPRVSSCGP